MPLWPSRDAGESFVSLRRHTDVHYEEGGCLCGIDVMITLVGLAGED